MPSLFVRILAISLAPLFGAALAVALGASTLGALACGALAAALGAHLTSQSMIREAEGLRARILRLGNDSAGTAEASRLPDTRPNAEAIASSIEREAQRLHERVRAAESERERLATVLASMSEGVLVLDAEGRIVLANPSLQEMFDVWNDLPGRRPLEVIRNVELDRILRDVATSDEPLVGELADVGPRELTLRVHASRVSEKGEHLGTVAVLHDLSGTHRLERMRRDFIANASHELRTPLTSIQGFADTLLAAPGGAAELAGPLEAIVRNAQRLSDLIDDLLELSRIEGGRDRLQITDVDVARACTLLIQDSEPRQRQRNIALDFVTEANAIAAADPGALEKVLSNLLDNALKYTDPGGTVTVAVRNVEKKVEIEIRDTGIGIAEDALPRIFERFYRCDAALSRAVGGTGLGLSIVRHLVQAMDGDVRVTSDAGAGSSFVVSLPRAASGN